MNTATHPTTTKASFVFLDHNFGNAAWEHFFLALLTMLLTVLSAEAITMGLELVFKRVLKIHHVPHDITVLISLLTMDTGLSHREAVNLIRKYGLFGNQLDYYASPEKVHEYQEAQASHHGYYRTNFFELLYFAIRLVIYILGFALSFYVVEYDFIAWAGGVGVSSVLVLYGLMPYIQAMIAVGILLYTDQLRVGRVFEVPALGRTFVLIRFGLFQLKVANLNKKVLDRLLGKTQTPTPPKVNKAYGINAFTTLDQAMVSDAFTQVLATAGPELDIATHHGEGGGGGRAAPVFLVPLPLPTSTQSVDPNSGDHEAPSSWSGFTKPIDNDVDRDQLIPRILNHGYINNRTLMEQYYELKLDSYKITTVTIY